MEGIDMEECSPRNATIVPRDAFRENL